MNCNVGFIGKFGFVVLLETVGVDWGWLLCTVFELSAEVDVRLLFLILLFLSCVLVRGISVPRELGGELKGLSPFRSIGIGGVVR